MPPSSFVLFESPSAADRVDAALDVLGRLAADQPVTIVGATRGAADDLARAAAVARPATLGVSRLSLVQLAARAATEALSAASVTPGSRLGVEALAARAVFDTTRAGTLTYLQPVAGCPGFARALATTLGELRQAGADRTHLAPLAPVGPDLARLLATFDEGAAAAGSVDRAALFAAAAQVLRRRPIGGTVVLLDLPIEQQADVELLAAVVGGAATVCATVPAGDDGAREALRRLGAEIRVLAARGGGDLAALRTHLFAVTGQPPRRAASGELEFFSAPGEGREAVEVARRILREARRGVRFDEMAVLVRAPRSYLGLLDHAFARAGVPAWFDRGTRRPHPAGRAFLALLACAAERLSAASFAEYLSLGQVPCDDEAAATPWMPAADETLTRTTGGEAAADGVADGEDEDGPAGRAGEGAAGPVGTVRAPWRWERLLSDAGVIGRDAARWHRRLDGYARELERQRDAAAREDGEEGSRVRGIDATREQLRELTAFALPIVDALAAWPEDATWGEWLARFEALAPRVLRRPAHVLRLLADLRPMAEVGPLALDEVRRVLADRLLTLEADPPARRFGRVFVGTPQQARGRSFRVVFVPGLAERLFPQKPREDPLLLDVLRERLPVAMATQHDRLDAERLLLRLAVGAARDRLYVSYPRIEQSESRARVPSFYALDIQRAVTGEIPDHEWLEARARDTGSALLAWPAPPSPDAAIDDQEHDLAVLRRLLDEPVVARVRGHAHYLLGLNEHLRRSVVDRWSRGQARWAAADGLIGGDSAVAAALADARLTVRPYSLSALQKFSACPYQFVLSALYRLQPLQAPEPLQRMDPLTRGSLFHEVQARLLRQLRTEGALPVTTATLDAASARLVDLLAQVAARAHDELAPAVERVWTDEVAAIGRDLQAWLQELARDGAEWEPRYFEFGFGRVPGERDAASVAEPVTLTGGFRLRGAIDLIERHRTRDVLRVTDHKTGRAPDQLTRVTVGGGTVLQPVLYGLAVEAALGARVVSGRLFYCTAAGSFTRHEIPLDEATRARGLEVLQVIDRAIAEGALPAAPAPQACERCEYRPVCGPDVARRVGRKPPDRLADLHALRSWP